MKTASKVALTIGSLFAGLVLAIGGCIGLIWTVAAGTCTGIKGVWK